MTKESLEPSMEREPKEPSIGREREPDETRIAYRSRQLLRRQRGEMAILVLVAVFASLASGFSAIAYAKHQQSVSDQRWCTLITNLDDRNARLKPPPANATVEQKQQYQESLEFAKQIKDLRDGLGCG